MRRDLFNSPGSYRIEVSGWGLDSDFFVEKADLVWSPGGEKRMKFRHALAEGAIVFVRLLSAESPNACVPVAHVIKEVEPMDCDGRCEMTLAQLHPRVKEACKESNRGKSASNELEDAPRKCDAPAGIANLAGGGVLL